MENKIRNYIYNDDTNYTSYDSMKYLFVCVCLFLSLITGTFAIVAKLWWGLCVLIFLDMTYLLYLIAVPHIKKTYRFRFLSEGIIATLLSFLCLSSAFITLYSAECDSPGITYATLISYILFTIWILAYSVCYAKSDAFQSPDKRSIKKYLIFSGALIPFSGTIGILIAKIIFKSFDFDNQVAAYVGYIIFVLVSFAFALGFSNYIKYYYCIKYKVLCDKNGNATSPDLEYRRRKKNAKRKKAMCDNTGNANSPNLEYRRRKKNAKHKKTVLEPPTISKDRSSKKNISLLIKILIGIFAIPIIFIFIVFLVFFIKGFIQGIS